MICLGVDCAGKTAGVAVMQDGALLYECSLNRGLTHSETLLCMVQNALHSTGLTCEEVSLYGVCAGPGSFTGLRIGLAAVKGLALPHGTLCAGVSTLEALARCCAGSGTVVCALDARRGEVYWAAFGLPGVIRLTPDTAQPMDALEPFLKNCKKPLFFVGDGAGLCYNRYDNLAGLVPCPAPLQASRALGVCMAACAAAQQGLAVPAAQLMPQYHRLSQAERERAARLHAGAEDPPLILK